MAGAFHPDRAALTLLYPDKEGLFESDPAARSEGGDSTEPDPDWSSLLPTPPHPEHPCAHCLQAAARAVVLAAELDDPDRVFEIASSTATEAAPRRVSLADYVEQTSLSRIYAGVHYRFWNEAGEATGERVGQAVLARWAGGRRGAAGACGRLSSSRPGVGDEVFARRGLADHRLGPAGGVLGGCGTSSPQTAYAPDVLIFSRRNGRSSWI